MVRAEAHGTFGGNVKGNNAERKLSMLRLLTTIAILVALPMSLSFAQSSDSAPKPTPTPRPLTPEEELTSKFRAARSDPAQTVELTVRLVKEFPEGRSAESAGFYLTSALKKQAQIDKDPTKLRALAERYITGTASAPSGLRVRTNLFAVRGMLDNGLSEQVVKLINEMIPLLDESTNLAFRRRAQERDNEFAAKLNPKFKPRPWVESEMAVWFRQDVTSYYTTLGRAHFKLDDLENAEAAFRKAYDLGHESPAAAGLASILEKRGKDGEALNYMTEAVLSGRLDKAGVAQFEELYRRTHKGSLKGVEEYLDARYRKGPQNPIKGEKHVAKGPRTGRAVLAEFITGAGCIPCIPFDYTFETALEDYSRRDLVLLVYHWHAPTLDPMGNRSSDSRVTYYDTNSAPTLVIDGEKFKEEVRSGDSRLRIEAVKSSQVVYTAVREAIDKRAGVAPEARIELGAERAGASIRARAVVDGFTTSLPDVSVHFALVEEELHYSGENGLRFHPMVVRNLARDKGWGYSLTGEPGHQKAVSHTFDLDAITAENLRYYEEWPAERNKEVNGRLGPDGDFDVGKFREQRNVMNPEKLYVAAFVQDNKTKKILQSTIVRVKGR
jgi:tetratricopeptide (TPR) repeat protein